MCVWRAELGFRVGLYQGLVALVASDLAHLSCLAFLDLLEGNPLRAQE